MILVKDNNVTRLTKNILGSELQLPRMSIVFSVMVDILKDPPWILKTAVAVIFMLLAFTTTVITGFSGYIINDLSKKIQSSQVEQKAFQVEQETFQAEMSEKYDEHSSSLAELKKNQAAHAAIIESLRLNK